MNNKISLLALALLPLAACGGGGGAASNTPPTVTQSQAAADFNTLAGAYGVQFIDVNVGSSNVAAPTTGTFNYAGHTRILNSNGGDNVFYGRTDYAIDFDTNLVAGEMYSVRDDSKEYASSVTFSGTVTDAGELSGTMSGALVNANLSGLFPSVTRHDIDAELAGNLVEDEDGQKLKMSEVTGTRTTNGFRIGIRVDSIADQM